jgi:Protein of unknown function (DUF3037)
MSEQAGYYSLIQFYPDPSRLEGVNIGVVVYSSADTRVQVRISQSNHRIRKFFGNQNWNLIRRARAAIEGQLRTQLFLSVEDLKAYISKRANAIQLTPPRPMRISDPAGDVDRLFGRLVGPDALERKRGLRGNLTKSFEEAGIVNLVRKSVDVEIPDFKKSIRVPYAYQNGRFNLISPVQFDAETDSILAKTGKSAIEGQLIYKNRHPDFGAMRLVVVANFDSEIENSTRERVRNIFDDHNVALYSFENLDPLIQDIRHSAAAHR